MKIAENRSWTDSGNVKVLDGPARELKRKHSPPRILIEAQVASAITTLGKAFNKQAHTPSRSPDFVKMQNANTGVELGGPFKTKTQSYSGKGKHVAERARVSKEITSQLAKAVCSASSGW